MLNRIVATAEVGPQDLVLEVGPGPGALTRRLVECGAHVVAIELDPRLCAELPARLGNPPNLTMVEGDARKFDIESLVGPQTLYKVASNLPFYAANPIIRRFLEAKVQPRLMVVTVQMEVAQGMTAMPGQMGFLSVAVQYYATANLVCAVPPQAFRPPPKVTSAVVRLEIRDAPPVVVADREAFFALVRAGFSSPRKQLRNSLAHGLGLPTSSVGQLLTSLDLDGTRRPATLSLDEWALVYGAWEQL